MTRQRPGKLIVKSMRGVDVAVGPVVGEGAFRLEVSCEKELWSRSSVLNRSELAALHAAIGELLAFYREFD